MYVSRYGFVGVLCICVCFHLYLYFYLYLCMFPDMGLWVYYREIYGGHGAACQTQKDILEASAYMSQTPLKRKNHSARQFIIPQYLAIFWDIFDHFEPA